MANLNTNLDLISSSQAQKEITANALFDSSSPATLGGRRNSTCNLLTWGYYGGNVIKDGNVITVLNGTIQLSDNSINFIQIDNDGNIFSNTTSFGSNTPLYRVTTSNGTVTNYIDLRSFLANITGSGYTLLPATETSLGGVKIPSNSNISYDENGNIIVKTATSSSLGVVRPDNVTITITNGVITAVGGGGSGGGNNNVGCNIVHTGYPFGVDTNYAGYTYKGYVASYDIVNKCSSFTFDLAFQSSTNINISSIVVKKTLPNDTSVISTTAVTINGSTSPTITIPAANTLFSVTTDPVSLEINSNYDYYILVYFSTNNASDLNLGVIRKYRNNNSLDNTQIFGDYTFGDLSSATTISSAKTNNFLIHNLKVFT